MMSEKDYFILSIVMALTKTQPAQLEEALELVKDLQKDEDEYLDVVRAPHLNPKTMKAERFRKDKKSSKEVLEYLSWIAEPDFLYNVALLTYNLDLTVMVAECTQKDPKEYLPYIETIRSIENEVDRRFKICFDTKSYEKGIKVLSEGTPEHIKKAMEIIKDKKLFAEGMKVFKGKLEQIITIRQMLADHLYSEKEYKQAAPLYLVNNDYTNALDCYEKTLDWKAALEIYDSSKLEGREEFLKKMKDSYFERKLYVDAGKIVRKMKNFDREEYISLIIDKGSEFRKLKKMVFDFTSEKDKEIVEKIIVPKLELQADVEITTYSKRIEDYTNLKKRLLAVQEKKRNNMFNIVKIT